MVGVLYKPLLFYWITVGLLWETYEWVGDEE